MLAKEKDLDAVIVATPDFWHARHAIAAMEAGLHVYLEKEMANTLEGARQIVQTQNEPEKLFRLVIKEEVIHIIYIHTII